MNIIEEEFISAVGLDLKLRWHYRCKEHRAVSHFLTHGPHK